MTYVDGHPVDRLDLLAESGHDFEELLRLGVRAWLESAFEHGLFHGDVHAGNLVLTTDGKVALPDFGIMGHLDPPVRAALRDALPGLLLGDDSSEKRRAGNEWARTCKSRCSPYR